MDDNSSIVEHGSAVIIRSTAEESILETFPNMEILIQKYPIIKCVLDNEGLLAGRVIVETIRNPEYTLDSNGSLEFLIRKCNVAKLEQDLIEQGFITANNHTEFETHHEITHQDVNTQREYISRITVCKNEYLGYGFESSFDFDVSTLTWNGKEFDLWTKAYGFSVNQVIKHCQEGVCYHRLIRSAVYHDPITGSAGYMRNRIIGMIKKGWTVRYMVATTMTFLSVVNSPFDDDAIKERTSV